MEHSFKETRLADQGGHARSQTMIHMDQPTPANTPFGLFVRAASRRDAKGAA